MRTILPKIIDITKNVLEIGASHSPLIDHSNPTVFNIDIMTREELIDKNIKEAWGDFDKDIIPKTDFLLSEENDFDFYKCIGDDIKFDYIVSSHNFEHFPNFIKSLNSLENILSEEGKIIAFIPDSRFEFDKYRNITKVTKLISDFYLNKKKPSFEELIDQRLHWNDITTKDLWIKYNIHKKMPNSLADDCLNIEYNMVLNNQIDLGNDRKEIESIFEQHSRNNYIDAHVNCFTPESFKNIMEILFKLKYTTLKIEKLNPTIEGWHEFSVILHK